MKTFDDKNNFPLEKVFSEVLSIYDADAVIPTRNPRSSGWYGTGMFVLFWLSMLLPFAALILEWIGAATPSGQTSLPSFLPNVLLAAAALLLFTVVQIHQRRTRKQHELITGRTNKNLSSFVNFQLNASNVSDKDLEVARDYANVLMEKDEILKIEPVSSYLGLFAIPFALGIVTAIIPQGFPKAPDSIQFIVSCSLWGIVGVLGFKLLTFIARRRSIKLALFKVHIEYTLLNRKAGKQDS